MWMPSVGINSSADECTSSTRGVPLNYFLDAAVRDGRHTVHAWPPKWLSAQAMSIRAGRSLSALTRLGRPSGGCALVAAAHTTDLLLHANLLLADASRGVPHFYRKRLAP